MMSNGFRMNECDKCVYIKDTANGYVIVCLYVDDMLIIDSNNDIIKATKRMLTNEFDMKDLGVVDVILGIENLTDLSYLNHIMLRKFLRKSRNMITVH